MKITHGEQPSFGQVSRSATWTQEEYDFVAKEYPREGFHQEAFLEIIVETFHPTGEELLYGWMQIMKYVKEGPSAFGKLERK